MLLRRCGSRSGPMSGKMGKWREHSASGDYSGIGLCFDLGSVRLDFHLGVVVV